MANALGGFGGNDEIDGGSGNDMIGGGKGSDNIKGGDGDDYISSSADVIKSQQQRGKDDVWQNYGLPQGKEALSTQALWGTYKETPASSDGVTIWAGITETDTSRTEGDVIDAGAGDDWVIASWGDDRIKGGEGKAPATTNLIALRADNTPANCRKRSKNFRKTNQRAFQCGECKPNQRVAVIDIAQRATKIVVTRDIA